VSLAGKCSIFWHPSVSMSMVTDLMHSFLMKCMEQCAWRSEAHRQQCEQFSLHVTQLRGRDMEPAQIFSTLWPSIKSLLDGRSPVALCALHYSLIEEHVNANNSIKKSKAEGTCQAGSCIQIRSLRPLPLPERQGQRQGQRSRRQRPVCPCLCPR
jgi:hypothetical protein